MHAPPLPILTMHAVPPLSVYDRWFRTAAGLYFAERGWTGRWNWSVHCTTQEPHRQSIPYSGKADTHKNQIQVWTVITAQGTWKGTKNKSENLKKEKQTFKKLP